MTRDDIIRMAHKAGFNMVHYSNKEPLLCEAWGDEIHLEHFAALVAAAEREALDEQIRSINHDCRIMCNALQRIEAGEAEPRMIARRTLEHWSEKSALEVKP